MGDLAHVRGLLPGQVASKMAQVKVEIKKSQVGGSCNRVKNGKACRCRLLCEHAHGVDGQMAKAILFCFGENSGRALASSNVLLDLATREPIWVLQIETVPLQPAPVFLGLDPRDVTTELAFVQILIGEVHRRSARGQIFNQQTCWSALLGKAGLAIDEKMGEESA